MKNKKNTGSCQSNSVDSAIIVSSGRHHRVRQALWCTLIPFFLSASCNKFLDAGLNKSQIDAAKVFENDVTASAAVTGIYNRISLLGFLTGGPLSINTLSGFSSGELISYDQSTDYKSFEQHQILPSSGAIAVLWQEMYTIIYRANAVLEGVAGSSSLSASTTNQLKGEALFMRAFSYFYLVNLYGDVPLILSTDYNKNRLLSRFSVQDVYDSIESDLLKAKSLLLDGYVSENKARPNRATATSLLARMYLYKKDYAKAEVEASSIIENSSYQLNEKRNIGSTFQINPNNETIWQIMPVSISRNTPEGYYFILNSSPASLASSALTDELTMHFETGDLRKVNWISIYTQMPNIYYFPFKYKKKDKTTNAPYEEASVVFRLAEMYLIRAEARTHLHNIGGAQADLNSIRTRAGLPNTPANDEESLKLAIENERWSEFFTEYGHRWLDLKRTGRAIQVLGDGITQSDLLWPIPAAEFTKNPNLGEQNQGY